MDEVAFIITGYNEDGTLRFESIGGINSKVIPSKVLLRRQQNNRCSRNETYSSSGSGGKEKKYMSYSDCCIDIGSNYKG